ncbi:MAG: hypothetical protein Q4F80_01100 [bacterium]|nr:hypothetical protein [bacterium]
MDLNKKEKITEFFVLAVFGLLTFYFLFQRVPFWDEAHAWMISKTFGFFELFKI